MRIDLPRTLHELRSTAFFPIAFERDCVSGKKRVSPDLGSGARASRKAKKSFAVCHKFLTNWEED